jgi:glutamate-5-semialdehyde dehydrogenase
MKSKVDMQIEALALAAREASRELAKAGRQKKDRALKAIASGLRRSKAAILSANAKDVAAGRKSGLSPAMLDRLLLDSKRMEGIAKAVEDVAKLPDPVGKLLEKRRLKNGLILKKLRSPLGVIGIVFESRPNVTVDAAVLCLKAGNASILRGGSEAIHSNRALGKVIQDGLKKAGLPKDAVSVVPTTDRAAVRALLQQRHNVDVIIPRGGRGLIDTVIKLSSIPVIRHDIGNCHVYVDKSANLLMAEKIAINAKVSRPGVCNAMEHLLVHRKIAKEFIPEMVHAFHRDGVEVRGDAATRKLAHVKPASDSEWYDEYLDLIVGIKVVPDLDAAIQHVNHYGSGHSDSIVSADAKAAARFQNEVDSAAVYWNASTRFTDGGEFGLGAEIGISTQKLHARGPMALEELTTMKWVVTGKGQVRG